MKVDAITLEVIRNGLAAAAEEMNASLIRTGYSPNIKERRDCSCAIFDAAGELISQAENIPVHLGAMPFSVRAALDRFPPETVEPGDGFLLNDPFHGGAHLPDLTLITPAFHDGTLLGFTANRAHHADVGGTHAGSVAANSTEIYQEGIRIPPVRLFTDDEPDDSVMELILANTRDPDERRGDLRAQQAANLTGRTRLLDLVESHGIELLQASLDAIQDYAERRMRQALAEIPDGEYSFTDSIEDDGRGNADLPICAEVTVDGDEVAIDFSESAEQSEGAINAVMAVTVSASYYAIRCLTDPDIPPNAGCYRPIDVSAPEGTIVNARPPAAVVGGNLETSQRIVDVVLGAFAEKLPDRTIAASQGTMNNVTFGGTNPVTGREFAFYETLAGGMGGRDGADGLDGVQIHMTNTMNTPVEVIETAYPLRVRRYELRVDSGGPGRWRGGLGIRRDIEVVAGDLTCSLLAERRRRAPYGIAGGASGAPGVDLIGRLDGFEQVAPKSTHWLVEGDVVSIRTPGGGGYGPPADREVGAIERDIEHEILSFQQALEDYPQFSARGLPDDEADRRIE